MFTRKMYEVIQGIKNQDEFKIVKFVLLIGAYMYLILFIMIDVIIWPVTLVYVIFCFYKKV